MLVAPGPIDVVHTSVRSRFDIFAKGRCGVHHRLFVSALVVAKRTAQLIEGLANPGDVAMTKDAKHSAEERLPPPVALARLRAEKTHQRLCHRQPNPGENHSVSGLGIMMSRTRLDNSPHAARN
jgi:hypothetical protein